MNSNYILQETQFSLLSKLMNYSGIGILILNQNTGQINWYNTYYQKITGGDMKEKPDQTFTNKLLEQLQIKNIVNIKHFKDLLSYVPYSSPISKICIQNNKGIWIWLHVEVAVYQPINTNISQLLIMITDLKENGTIDKIDGHSDNTINPKNYYHKLLNILSKREIEILKLIVIGYTNKNIAEELCISSNTVDTHRKNIIRKLKVKNTTRLAYIVGKNNLL